MANDNGNRQMHLGLGKNGHIAHRFTVPTGDVGVTACEDSGLFGLQDVCGGRLFIAVGWQSAYSHRHVLHVQLQGVCLAVGMFVICPVRLCVCWAFG